MKLSQRTLHSRHVSLALLAIVAILPISATGESLDFTVMTFNLKNGASRGENAWEVRRPIVKNLIQEEKPDLIGTQEGFFFQIKDMDEDLPEYEWIGLGRAGGSKDEFMAVFYKRNRFEVMAFDHFWLSDTPEVIGSRTWGHNNRRMVTWVRFRERESGREFYHWNTHFDHRVAEARRKSAALIMERLQLLEPKAPVIVTGDFNASQDSDVHAAMVSTEYPQVTVRDAWELAENHIGDQVGTFNGWRGPNDSDRRIDWILVSPEFTCDSAEVVTYAEDGQYPSDHFPVVGNFTLTTK